MSIFAYASGGVDQVGGDIILPEVLTHLPRFQGEKFTLPPGLAITGERAYIWELAKPYLGVLGITNPTSETPTINFDAETFSEPFVEIKCRVQGQPLNFIVYLIYTSLSSTWKAGNNFHSSLEFYDYNIQDQSFTIDNSIIIEANNINSLQSGLILYWKPPEFGKVDFYKIEKWGNGWEYIGTSPRPSYIIFKESTTYKITPRFSKLKPGIEESKTISVNLEGTFAKDILTLNLTSNAYLDNTQPINTNAFYTAFITKDYEDSLIATQKVYTETNFNQDLPNYPDSFWTQLLTEDYIDDLGLTLSLDTKVKFTQSNLTYPDIFWSKGIGI